MNSKESKEMIQSQDSDTFEYYRKAVSLIDDAQDSTQIISEAHGKFALFCNDVLDDREKGIEEEERTEDDDSDGEIKSMEVSDSSTQHSRIPHMHSDILATSAAESYMKGNQSLFILPLFLIC